MLQAVCQYKSEWWRDCRAVWKWENETAAAFLFSALGEIWKIINVFFFPSRTNRNHTSSLRLFFFPSCRLQISALLKSRASCWCCAHSHTHLNSQLTVLCHLQWKMQANSPLFSLWAVNPIISSCLLICTHSISESDELSFAAFQLRHEVFLWRTAAIKYQ